MKKLVVPAVLILLLQLVTWYLSVNSSLIFTDSGSGEWFEFSSWWPIGLIALIFLPIAGGRWLSKLLNHQVSWKRSIAIYFGLIGLAILVAILWSTVHSSRY
ncbi:hypothetical protein HYW35_02640 [Candidatus Saccharibacteria bacterium]|nr:hypothetical protein [Candidatus Saccharibacteria bacterium]